MSDKYDLDKITYEPRFRNGYGATGMPGELPKLHDHPMVYWVGSCYGPYATEDEAKEASARMVAQKEDEDRRWKECEARAEAARSKLTPEEWESIYSLGYTAGRGY